MVAIQITSRHRRTLTSGFYCSSICVWWMADGVFLSSSPFTLCWNRFPEAYTNPNFTTWVNDFKQPFPKNSFKGEC